MTETATLPGLETTESPELVLGSTSLFFAPPGWHRLTGRELVVDLGGQYSIVEQYDPADYYGIEFDPADYYESEYMNE